MKILNKSEILSAAVSVASNFTLIDEAFDSPFGHDLMAYFLRDRGTRLRGSALPSKYSRLKPRECFRNSWDIALSAANNLEYWEGWAWHADTGMIPFHHAWCMDSISRKVVDLTWRDPQDAVYCGVHVPRLTLCAIIEETRKFGVLDQGRGFARDIVAKYFRWTMKPAEMPAFR